MKRSAAFLTRLVVAAALMLALGPRLAGRDRPLSLDDIKTLHSNSVPEARLEDLIDQYGINFSPTREALAELTRSGLPASIVTLVSKQIPRGQTREYYLREADRLSREGHAPEAESYRKMAEQAPSEAGKKGTDAEAGRAAQVPSPERKQDRPESLIDRGPRKARVSPPSVPLTAQARAGIFINGRELTAQQVQEIRALYGFVAPPGRYWYDSRSGLFGLMGYEAAGFLRPGHEFGPLPPNASNGHTGVFINGREINLVEAAYCQQVFGAVYRGHWWLDGLTGNMGAEGNPMPIANVYALLRQTQQRNSGGSYSWHSNATGASGGSGGGCSYISIPGSGSVMTGNCN